MEKRRRSKTIGKHIANALKRSWSRQLSQNLRQFKWRVTGLSNEKLSITIWI